MLVLAVTGSIYLFKPQIENWLYRDLYHVPPATQQVSPEVQLGAALAAFPDGTPQAYLPFANLAKSTLVRIRTTEGRELTVAVNPHTGKVLGSIDNRNRPMQMIRNLHGKLLLGKTGQAIQELAASWAMILIITGLYLWWPRQRSRTWGVLLPRLNLSGRVLWRDLHAVTGFWVSGLLIFLILTGLPWSVVSGGFIHQAAAHLGKGSPNTGLGWGGGGSHLIKSSPIGQDWTIDHAQQLAGAGSLREESKHEPLKLSQVLRIASALPGIHPPFEVRFPVDARGVYSIVINQDSNPAAIAYVHLDQYTGKVIKDVRWKDFGPLAQAIALGVSLHEGQYFGLANQLLGLIACLGLIFLTVAGIAMWWQRRPVGSLGAPTAPSNFRPGPRLVGLMVLLSLLMPLMGASLIVILALEWLMKPKKALP